MTSSHQNTPKCKGSQKLGENDQELVCRKYKVQQISSEKTDSKDKKTSCSNR